MSPVQSIPPPSTVTLATPNNNILNTATKYITAVPRSRKTMSDALSIANITQKQMAYEAIGNNGTVVAGGATAAVSVEQSAVAAVAAAYQYNYNHLYADRAAAAAAMYAAPPIIFSGPTHPALTVAAPMHAHANYKYNGASDSNTVFSSAYFNAIQNAVKAGMFSPTQVTTQIPPSSPAIPASSLTPPTPTLPKSPNLLVSAAASPPINAHNNKIGPGGTYLNEKAFNAKNGNAEGNYFKVPSGKEGSMKHRILTRPQNITIPTTNPNCQSMCHNEEISQNAVMRTYDTTSNFRKGSYIELANGVLRKVEDMRTEDFIQCAERSPHHKLAESTVVKIDLTPANTVVITFSYDNNRSRADVEVSHDHPFFVYGQGWASYIPEVSAKVFGLRCQRLQVGDICISLTRREHYIENESVTNLNVPTTAPSAAINMTVTGSTPPLPTNESSMRFTLPTEYANGALPLTPHTPPAALVSTSNHLNLTPSLAAAHYAVASHNIPYHLLPSHLAALGAGAHPYSTDIADLVSAYAYHAHLNTSNATVPPLPPPATKMMNSYYHTAPPPPPPPSAPPHPHVYHAESQAKKAKEDYKHVYHAHYEILGPQQSPTADSHYHAQLHTHHHHQQLHVQSDDEPVDATIARKRRWSAPEDAADEEEHKRLIAATAINNADSRMYKIYKPSPVVAAVPPLLGSTQI